MVEIDGSVRPKERVARLGRFKAAQREDPRVLLLSSVGTVGLNIPFANILICIVSSFRFESPSLTNAFIGSPVVRARQDAATRPAASPWPNENGH